MVLTRMIFAIQMTDSQPTRLRVSGNVGTHAPPMTCLRRGASAPTSVNCVDGVWTTDLDAGDYIVEIQVEDDQWVAGRFDIAIELTPGQRPPLFVHHGQLPRNPPTADLAAWEATGLSTDPPALSAAGDPKDPWPPPPPPPPWAPLAPDSAAWFAAELAAVQPRIADQLVEARGKGVPASVLDALVNGR